MNEPDNLTGWIDPTGRAWVRVDDCPGSLGPWWCRLADSPSIGAAHDWETVAFLWKGSLTPASPDLTAETIELVRQEVAR